MKEYQTITEISGPLVFAEIDEPIGYDEIVEIETPDGGLRRGQVLDRDVAAGGVEHLTAARLPVAGLDLDDLVVADRLVGLDVDQRTADFRDCLVFFHC